MKKLLVVLFTLPFCFISAAYADKRTVTEVTFCRPNNMVSALLYIADAKGFFTSHFLNPKFETATNGKLCQDMLLARKVDYVATAEGPFTYLAASNPPIKIIAMIGRNPETSLFVRKDKGISSFSDLKGKTVAYLPGTVSYFFLGRVLKKCNLQRSDLKLTSMQPPTMPTALVGGSIDAFSMWEPWGSQAMLQMPENVINLADPSIYQYESLLLAQEDSVKSRPEVPRAILLALIDAENFVRDHNNEAFDLLSKLITFEPTAFKRLWPLYEHRVRLESKPIELMKENFKLLQEDDLNFKDSPMPNFKAFVDDSYLRDVAPDRIQQ